MIILSLGQDIKLVSLTPSLCLLSSGRVSQDFRVILRTKEKEQLEGNEGRKDT